VRQGVIKVACFQIGGKARRPLRRFPEYETSSISAVLNAAHVNSLPDF
jgi:hypothetical protein